MNQIVENDKVSISHFEHYLISKKVDDIDVEKNGLNWQSLGQNFELGKANTTTDKQNNISADQFVNLNEVSVTNQTVLISRELDHPVFETKAIANPSASIVSLLPQKSDIKSSPNNSVSLS